MPEKSQQGRFEEKAKELGVDIDDKKLKASLRKIAKPVKKEEQPKDD